MNSKTSTVFKGALEAALAGFLWGVASVWDKPASIIFTQPELLSVLALGAKFGVTYFIAFLRMNLGFQEPKLIREPEVK